MVVSRVCSGHAHRAGEFTVEEVRYIAGDQAAEAGLARFGEPGDPDEAPLLDAATQVPESRLVRLRGVGEGDVLYLYQAHSPIRHTATNTHDGRHGPANYAVGRPVGHLDQVAAHTSPAESSGFERQRPGLDGDQSSREEWDHHGQKGLETSPEVSLEVKPAGLLGLDYGLGPALHLGDELERGHEHVGQFRGQPLVYKGDHHRLGMGGEHQDQDGEHDHKHPEEY
jgi:hypothetical protein